MISVDPSKIVLKPSVAKIYCEPGWKWAKREKPLENYDLFYVWSGRGEVTLNGMRIPVAKGSCFLFRPGDFTSAVHKPQEPLVLTYIHFQIEGAVAFVPEAYRKVEDPTVFEHLLTRYVRIYLSDAYGAAEEARLILKQLMIQLLRGDRQKTLPNGGGRNRLMDAVREAANYIRQHPALPHSTAELAARAQLSPKYFSQKFKQVHGTTVQQYIIACRMERAEYLLTYSGMNVSETADALGYRDMFFFSRQFKQHTGRNPSELL